VKGAIGGRIAAAEAAAWSSRKAPGN